jgi:hypothetical protein
LKPILLISFVILAISFWNRNEFPDKTVISPKLAQAPIQELIQHSEFSVSVDDKDYFIQPKYNYELYGMVVSYRVHNGDTGAHLRWGDHLNVADYCVVWSENAFEARLDEMTFRNQEWTCYYQYPNREVGSSFDGTKLSNNHLISGDSEIRERIKQIGIGDQIRIKGWLSSYRSTERFIRGTSINRIDTGNGACETIYVNEIEILSVHTSFWKKLMYASLLIFLAALARYFYTPFKLNE